MQRLEHTQRVEEVRRHAHGRWTELLRSLGVDDRILERRNGPCPRCGGTDRFQYTDKFGEGNYHCRGCGPGGGFKLLQAVTGQDFSSVLRVVEERLGCLPATRHTPANPSAQPPSAERMQKLAQRIWEEAKPVTAGDEVDRYLRGRGLALTDSLLGIPTVLRFHPALGYYDRSTGGKARKLGEYPAMLACIQGPDGQAVSLHRTYLQDGRPLAASDAKKILSTGISGAAVRLFEAGHTLALAEGIETALAVHLATGQAVWAGLSAGNLEKLWLPETVRHVCIYADNDADGDYAGQSAGFALARRLKREGRPQVKVFLPRVAGSDWADVWQSRTRRRKRPG